MYLTQGCHHFFSFLNLQSKIKENNPPPPCGKPRYPSHSWNILMNPRTYVYIYKLGNTNFLRYKNQIIHTSICVISHNPSSLTFFTIAFTSTLSSVIYCYLIIPCILKLKKILCILAYCYTRVKFWNKRLYYLLLQSPKNVTKLQMQILVLLFIVCF